MILQTTEVRLCTNFRFWPQRMKNDLKKLLFRPYHPAKSPWGTRWGWDLAFLHVALVKPSVEKEQTGLDSWPFPTPAQLVHLKRPCDRNSMRQEIKCSCIPVVCLSIIVLFSLFSFSASSHFFFSGNEPEESRLSSLIIKSKGVSAHTVMFPRISLDGIVCPPPTPRSLWDFFAERLRQPLQGKPGISQSQALLWKWMSALAVNHLCHSLIFRGVWGSFRVWLTLLTHFLVAPIISKPNHWKSTYLCQTSRAESALSVSSSSSLLETDDACTIAWRIPKTHLDINICSLSNIFLRYTYLIFKKKKPLPSHIWTLLCAVKVWHSKAVFTFTSWSGKVSQCSH